MACLTSGIPVHSSILPSKPLERVGLGLLCSLALTELVHLAEEKQPQRENREVLCQQTPFTMDTEQEEETS